VLQLAAETDATLWERRHLIDEPPPAWLHAAAPPTARIGYDPRLFAAETLTRFAEGGPVMVAVETNPIDAIWTDRPAPPMAPAVPHPVEFAGRTSAEKRAEIADILARAGEDEAVLTDPASIAWLFNLRGGDLPFTPVALAFGLIAADGTATLFIAPEKVDDAVREWLGNAVAVAPPHALPAALDALTGKRADRLRAAGATVVAGPDPCLLPKATKSAAEQAGARAAHVRDAAALCRFLHWLDTVPPGRETELSAAARLRAFRAELPLFHGESFPAIVGSGPDGAIIHYRATEATDRPIGPDAVFLIDSGGQFQDGTTDVTRTVWIGPGAPPDSVRDAVTRVLQGHIAIATLVFPEGIAGPHLDAFARRALWSAGQDYDHGTGHGVGSFLSVHEGPQGLSRAARPVPFAPGMIVSNEPGYYLPGQFGVRLENLLLVAAADGTMGAKPFLRFETLTLAPFDRRLIRAELLLPPERAWLDAYHARVLETVGPSLDDATRAWLTAACTPIG
jgi:Xaa-Pro aminopeptidase